MKGINFPVFRTKTEGVTRKFDLNDPIERREYFLAKAGPEIEKLKDYVRGDSFVAYLLGKKNSGKGTYTKLFMEAVDGGRVGHVSVGDIVRDVHASLSDPEKKAALAEFLGENYRGFHSVEEVFDLIEGRSQSSLLSTELILALLKYEISKRAKQAIFIDGFPRGLDQIAYALFLREILGYREDPDFFVFIDVPEAVIDARIKTRVVCPVCKTPRNTKLAPTKYIGYDETQKDFYLMCDNPGCNKTRMIPKEGDELGIEPIRKRLEVDDQVSRQLLKLTGVPKILLRNSVPVDDSDNLVDDYEMTPIYDFRLEGGEVKTVESPWIVNDDNGTPSYSLLPAAVAVALIKETAKVLDL